MIDKQILGMVYGDETEQMIISLECIGIEALK